ncbi:discoidin domain-containing protein [Paenibacillus sp. NPDC058174]|uniref:discoidin domain-containing protein n=1 Tax=Paenibacillus sp. NPDC058174 TaxID=3346366 RepID=UPI0036DA84C7
MAIVAGLITVPAPKAEAALPPSSANNTIFGPNVYVFDPSTPAAEIQNVTGAAFTSLESNEFSSDRYAFLFKPGSYNVNFNVGFYTHVAGLGQNPGDVNINGGVNVNADWDNGNATRNFWRSMENLTITPSSGTTQIAVSQAAPLRRLHIKGELHLFDFDNNWNAGWASGGFLADSIVDGTIVPASQQQWFSRNSQWGNWTNGVWNMVFVGNNNAPTGNFPDPPYTVVEKTPVMREKPYLYVDNAGGYRVFVPSLTTNTQGVSWANGSTPGQSLPIDQFYIARSDQSTAATINAALAQGKHVLFTPGVYHLSQAIQVNNPNTVILGIGMPTLIPDQGTAAINVADVDGVKLAGLMIDAGPVNSATLVKIGTAGSAISHAANPVSLHDITVRTGGATAGRNDVGIEINSNDVIGDHFWLWRADHGAGAAWTTNVSKNGLIVNGNNVTLYGLFNEHHNEYQTIWNGNNGRLYFYQSEIPYDVPNQSSWMSNGGTVNGYASYKVADTVTNHEAWGLGVYSFFRDAAVKLNSAIEVPNTPGIKIHHATTIWLSGTSGSEITHIINNLGGKVYANSPAEAMRQTLSEFAGNGAVDTQPPSVPQNLTATAVSSSQINLSWTASTDNVGVTGYNVYRNGTLIGTSAQASYNDTGLTASTAYTYTVAAKDAAGNVSAVSAAATATTQQGGGTGTALNRSGWTAESSPSSGDAAANLFDGNMATRWSTGAAMQPGQTLTVDMKAVNQISKVVLDSTGSNDDYARGYELYVSTDGSNWGSAAATGVGTGPVLTISFTERNARYIRIVQTGTVSNWWSARELNVFGTAGTAVDTQPPSAPQALTATAASASQVNLSWTASTDNVGVTGYEVYRNGTLVGTTTHAAYSDTGLAASTSYTYTVKAKDAAGNVSANSNTASVTTPSAGGTTALDRTGWTASSTPSSGDVAANLFDGNMATRWSTGAAMAPGQTLIVDMAAVRNFNKIVMDSTGSDNDYARGYEVYVSNDGMNWSGVIASGNGSGPVVTAQFAGQSARYLKLVQTGTATSWWSIRELNVYV